MARCSHFIRSKRELKHLFSHCYLLLDSVPCILLTHSPRDRLILRLFWNLWIQGKARSAGAPAPRTTEKIKGYWRLLYPWLSKDYKLFAALGKTSSGDLPYSGSASKWDLRVVSGAEQGFPRASASVLLRSSLPGCSSELGKPPAPFVHDAAAPLKFLLIRMLCNALPLRFSILSTFLLISFLIGF